MWERERVWENKFQFELQNIEIDLIPNQSPMTRQNWILINGSTFHFSDTI